MDGLLQNFARNSAYLRPGVNLNEFATSLPADKEAQFRNWVTANKVPFDPNAQGASDYDMRGFWQALQNGDQLATTAVDPNDNRMHYPDYWKTPYHATFSNESQWADPTKAPGWNDKDQLVLPNGQIIFDDRAQNQTPQADDLLKRGVITTDAYQSLVGAP